jgi:hypothetical protein
MSISKKSTEVLTVAYFEKKRLPSDLNVKVESVDDDVVSCESNKIQKSQARVFLRCLLNLLNCWFKTVINLNV